MRIYSLLLFITLFTACSGRPEIDGFDKSSWIKELMGCGKSRSEQVPRIISQREKLIGLQQPAVIEILGTPDEHELYKRNQKFFKYYTSCAVKNSAEASYLQIRFNALGQSIAVDHYQ